MGREPKYQITAAYGHFGGKPYTENGMKYFEWENATDLSKYAAMTPASVEAELKKSNYLQNGWTKRPGFMRRVRQGQPRPGCHVSPGGRVRESDSGSLLEFVLMMSRFHNFSSPTFWLVLFDAPVTESGWCREDGACNNQLPIRITRSERYTYRVWSLRVTLFLWAHEKW